MHESRPALFRGRHFRSEVIVLCVRWYLRYPLSYRDLEEMMAERGLAIDHSTIARWVLYYAPILDRRIRREMRQPNGSWRVDETYVRVAGKWTYLYRAIDSAGDTIDFLLSPNRDLIAAKGFLRLALSAGQVRPRVINVDGHPSPIPKSLTLRSCENAQPWKQPILNDRERNLATESELLKLADSKSSSIYFCAANSRERLIRYARIALTSSAFKIFEKVGMPAFERVPRKTIASK